MGVKKLIQCPECRFANRYGDARCLMCKSKLPKPPPGSESPNPRRPGARRPPGQPPQPNRTQALQTQRAWRKKPSFAQRPPRPRTKRAERPPGDGQAAKTICWLSCDPLPPIPLGPKPTITVGRSDTCDLVLPHKEVSRVHGLIKVRLKSSLIVYEDEGSSNGSYLNGKRTPSSILREGDLLTIGPYEIMVKSNADMHSRHDKDDTTGSLELTSVSRLKPTAAMTGLLQEVPMTEVLQGIEFNKKTGTLGIVGPGRREGELLVRKGQPLRAHFADLTGDEAVLEMITLKEGRFTLTGEVDSEAEREMRSSLTGLLLEASRRIDEVGLNAEGDEPLLNSSDAYARPGESESEIAAAWGEDDEDDEGGANESQPQDEPEVEPQDPSVNTTVNDLFEALEEKGES